MNGTDQIISTLSIMVNEIDQNNRIIYDNSDKRNDAKHGRKAQWFRGNLKGNNDTD